MLSWPMTYNAQLAKCANIQCGERGRRFGTTWGAWSPATGWSRILISKSPWLMGMLINGHVGHVDGHSGWHGDAVEDLDNDTIAGGEGEEGGESGIGGQLKLFPDTTIEHFTNSIWTFCQPQQCQILIITPTRTQARYIIYQTGSEIAC